MLDALTELMPAADLVQIPHGSQAARSGPSSA